MMKLRVALIVAGIALSGCGGGSSSTHPPTPPTSAPATNGHGFTLTLLRSAATSNAQHRRTQQIPAQTRSVEALVWVGPALGQPVSASCVAFPASATSVTLTVAAPLGTDTIHITAYDGPCSGNAGSGNALTRYAATGTVLASSTSFSAVFASGGPVVLTPVLHAVSPVPVSTSWTSLGPTNYAGAQSGKFNSFVRNPQNPNVMYLAGGYGAGWEVATQAGVYKSTNGGVSWQQSNTGMTDATVNALWMDPANSNTLLAATQYDGIYRSVDGGSSWSLVQMTSGVIAFATSGSTLLAATSSGVMQSVDDGVTWTTAYVSATPVVSVTAAGTAAYAGLSDGTVVALNGGTWSVVGHVLNTTYLLHELIVDPATPTTLYATVNVILSTGAASQGLEVSTNGGATWNTVNTPSFIRGAQVVGFSRTVPHKAYVLGTGGVVTTDDGATQGTVNTAGDSRALTVETSGTGGDLLDLTSDQGLAFSTDGAQTWRYASPGISNNVMFDIAVSGSTILTAVQDYAPLISRNGGASWTLQSSSFYENGVAFIDPGNPALCMLWDSAGFHRSTDNCQTFPSMPAGVSGNPPGAQAIASDPSSPSTIYVATASGVEKSVDSGATFSATGWPIPQPTSVWMSPVQNTSILVGSGGSNPGYYASLDGGATWTRVGFPTGFQYDYAAFAWSTKDLGVGLLALDTFTGYVVYRTVDGGLSWEQLSPNGLPVQSQHRSARGRRVPSDLPWTHAFDVEAYSEYLPERMMFASTAPSGRPPYVAMSTSRGLLISTDYGTTWTDASGNALTHAFFGLAWSGNTLYASTAGRGVVVSQPLF